MIRVPGNVADRISCRIYRAQYVLYMFLLMFYNNIPCDGEQASRLLSML